MRPRFLLIYGVILVVSLSPLMLAGLAHAIAWGLSVRLHEGAPPQAEWFGWNLGPALYSMMVLGWLSVLSIPMGLGCAALVLVYQGVLWFRRRP